MRYTVYSIQHTVYSIQYLVTVYSRQYAVYSVQCRLCSVHYTVYSIQYTVAGAHAAGIYDFCLCYLWGLIIRGGAPEQVPIAKTKNRLVLLMVFCKQVY